MLNSINVGLQVISKLLAVGWIINLHRRYGTANMGFNSFKVTETIGLIVYKSGGHAACD
jgi:hypothetical protein